MPAGFTESFFSIKAQDSWGSPSSERKIYLNMAQVVAVEEYKAPQGGEPYYVIQTTAIEQDGGSFSKSYVVVGEEKEALESAIRCYNYRR